MKNLIDIVELEIQLKHVTNEEKFRTLCSCINNNQVPYYYIRFPEINNFFSIYGLFVKYNYDKILVYKSLNKALQLEENNCLNILAIDGIRINEYDFSNINNRSSITLTISNNKKIYQVQIVQKIEKKITNRIMIKKDIAYIGCVNFDEINSIKTNDFTKIKKVFLDLRYNTGGKIKDAISLLEIFSSKKNKIEIMNYDDCKFCLEYEGKGIVSEKADLVIIVNSYTMSSAEMIVSELKTIRNAKIIGRNTFGKNIIQKELKLFNKYSLIIPVYSFVYRCIHDRGSILPDIIVDENISISDIIKNIRW